MSRKIFFAGVVALLLLSLVGCGVGDSGDAVDKVAKGLSLGGLWKETPLRNTLSGVVTVRDYEGVRIGDGKLMMKKGDYQGKYQVLLNIYSPFPDHGGCIRLGGEKEKHEEQRKQPLFE